MTGRPSSYLQKLQSLARRAGIADCTGLIRHKFLSSLPYSVFPAIEAQTSLTLTQLDPLADELMPMHNNFCNFTPNQQPYKGSWKSREHENFKKEAQILPMGLYPFYNDQRPNICRSHLYFGDKARSCKPWC